MFSNDVFSIGYADISLLYPYHCLYTSSSASVELRPLSPQNLTHDGCYNYLLDDPLVFVMNNNMHASYMQVPTVAPKYTSSSPHPVSSSPHPVSSSPHPVFSSPHPVSSSPHPVSSSPHPVSSSWEGVGGGTRWAGCGEEEKGCGEEEKGCGEGEKGCGEEKKVYFGATVTAP